MGENYDISNYFCMCTIYIHMSRRLLKHNSSQVYKHCWTSAHFFNSNFWKSNISLSSRANMWNNLFSTFPLFIYYHHIIKESKQQADFSQTKRENNIWYHIRSPLLVLRRNILLLIVNFNRSKKNDKTCIYKVNPPGWCDSSSENLLRFEKQ